PAPSARGGAPDTARRPTAAAMNCDDAGGRIGEGYKGTNGLGHDKDLRKMSSRLTCADPGRGSQVLPGCGLRSLSFQWPRSHHLACLALTQNDILGLWRAPTSGLSSPFRARAARA